MWRYTSPYRGLAAMEEKDSDYFFGRERETVDALSVLAAASNRLSCYSVIRASVSPRLHRQACLLRSNAKPGPKGADTALGFGRALSGKPPLVFPDAQARNRAAQGAGRVVPRHLATWRDRARASASSRMTGSNCLLDGEAQAARST